MWAGCALRTFSLTAMLLVAGSPALAFKKQFKDVQCIHSNVGHAATNGQTHVTLENDNRQQLANDMLITGEDSPSLWGLLSVLRKMKLDIQHFHGSKEELKKQIDILREMLVYPALQIHLDNLYARELERQE